MLRRLAASFCYSFFKPRDESATGRSAGSLAWAGLFNTYYWIDPTAELASVICMQMLPFFDGPCIDLFERFERAVYDSA